MSTRNYKEKMSTFAWKVLFQHLAVYSLSTRIWKQKMGLFVHVHLKMFFCFFSGCIRYSRAISKLLENVHSNVWITFKITLHAIITKKQTLRTSSQVPGPFLKRSHLLKMSFFLCQLEQIEFKNTWEIAHTSTQSICIILIQPNFQYRLITLYHPCQQLRMPDCIKTWLQLITETYYSSSANFGV